MNEESSSNGEVIAVLRDELNKLQTTKEISVIKQTLAEMVKILCGEGTLCFIL
jgi:hypothetical protein